MSLLLSQAGPSDPADLFSSASTSFDNPYVDWFGAFDDNASGLTDRRLLINNFNYVALRVKGSQLRIRCSAGGSQPFDVSVDGGAFSTPTLSSNYITAFTGLSDSWHDVVFRSRLAYTLSAEVFKTSAWEITGADPKITFHTSFGCRKELCYQSSFQSNGLISAGATSTLHGGGAYANVFSYGSFGDVTVFRNAIASEVFVYHMDGSVGTKYTLAANGQKIATVATAESRGILRLGNIDSNVTTEIAVSTNNTAGRIFGLAVRGGSGFTSSAITEKKKLCCFGDSITEAVTGLTESTIGYCYKLSLNNGWQPINRGIGGNTVSQMLTRVGTVNSTSPDYVIVLGGRNDWGNSVQTDYEAILDSLMANTSAKVLAVGTFNPGGTGGANRTTTNNSIEAAVTAVADSRILYINTDSLTAIDTFDGTHPNDAGYNAIVSFLQPYVTSHFV